MTLITPNFQSLLDETPDHVERPKALPVGTYIWIVGQPTYGKSSKKGTPFVEFQLRCIGATDDVDTKALEDMGGFNGKTLRATYYTTEDAIYRLDEFHEHCGLNLEEPASRRMRNDLVVNSQVLGYVRHREQEITDDERRAGVEPQVFAELSRTAPVES